MSFHVCPKGEWDVLGFERAQKTNRRSCYLEIYEQVVQEGSCEDCLKILLHHSNYCSPECEQKHKDWDESKGNYTCTCDDCWEALNNDPREQLRTKFIQEDNVDMLIKASDLLNGKIWDAKEHLWDMFTNNAQKCWNHCATVFQQNNRCIYKEFKWKGRNYSSYGKPSPWKTKILLNFIRKVPSTHLFDFIRHRYDQIDYTIFLEMFLHKQVRHVKDPVTILNYKLWTKSILPLDLFPAVRDRMISIVHQCQTWGFYSTTVYFQDLVHLEKRVNANEIHPLNVHRFRRFILRVPKCRVVPNYDHVWHIDTAIVTLRILATQWFDNVLRFPYADPNARKMFNDII